MNQAAQEAIDRMPVDVAIASRDQVIQAIADGNKDETLFDLVVALSRRIQDGTDPENPDA